MEEPHNYKKGLIFALIGALSSILMMTFVKLSKDVPEGMTVFFRNLVSFVLISPFLIHKKFPVKTKRFRMHLLRAASGLTAIYCFFYAASKLPLTNLILLMNTFILFIPLIILIWEKLKVSKRNIVAIIIGFFGIVLILKPQDTIPIFPSIIGLFGGMCAALAYVCIRKLAKTESTNCILFYFFSLCVIFSFFPMIFTWEQISSLMWLYLILVALFAVGYQYGITTASKYMPSSKVGCVMYSAVIFGAFFDWLLWNHKLDKWTVAGCFFIILGGALSLLDKSKPVSISKKH